MARKKTTGPTDRELAILGALWERGPSTVREVHEALHQDDEDETGYTTTLKLMQIMVEKGSLVREEEDGRRHIYRPAVSEERTQKQLVQNLLDRVFAGSAEKLVMRALSARKVAPHELKRIRKMIEEMEEA